MPLYPYRTGVHRNMGPPDSCDKCAGRGWHHELLAGSDSYDAREVYCDCECGVERKRLETEP